MSAADEQEDLLARLMDLIEMKRVLLASIDTNMAKISSGLPAEESTDE